MKRPYRCIPAVTWFMLAILMAAQGSVRADDLYKHIGDVGSGSLLTAEAAGNYRSLTRINCRYRVQVSGMVARTELQQSFRNDSQQWIEAIYVFPLPSKAAVNAMRIRAGERVIEGEIKERQAARRAYVKARAEGKRAGLVEQQRPNLFTTRVANIGPGDVVTVELDYVQTLDYDQGVFRMRLPMTITPRYIPGKPASPDEKLMEAHGWSFPTDQVPDADEITPPQIHAGDVPAGSHQADVEIDLDPGFQVASFNSPYVPIDISRSGADYHVTPKTGPVPMDRDFVLTWKPVPEQTPARDRKIDLLRF